VEPLGNADVEHDLVVDTRGFYDRLRPAARPLIRRDRLPALDGTTGTAGPGQPGGPAAADGEAGASFARYEDCIECGLCVSACPIMSTDPRYLGRPP
jgi:succinate dehydrogenase / fumarate reductase, iron-sulfur subunit